MTAAPLILYVEDNPVNRRLVRRLVTAVGWEYDEVHNGHQALGRLQELPLPDLILMDLAMPLLDGYRTTELIKQDVTLAEIPVIAVTAHNLAGDEEKARAAGCDAYLTKPLELDHFLATIRQFLPEVPSEQAVETAPTPSHEQGAPSPAPPLPEGPDLAPVTRCLQAVIAAGGAPAASFRPAIEELRRLSRPPEGKNP